MEQTQAKQAPADDKAKKERPGKITAQLMTRPSFMGAHTAMSFVPSSMKAYGEADTFSMWEEFRNGIQQVVEGDMTLPESILMGQAMTLNAIFSECASLAGINMRERLSHGETLMRMAMKAQAQCTQTLRVLGELKHPRQAATFVKQANIAHGPQQVNNGATPAHTEKSEAGIVTNELLTDEREAQHAATLDTGATSRAGRGNQTLAAVGAVDRADE